MPQKYTIEEKIENFFSSLRPRYRPFQMHQFCFTCGRELHRSQFKMSLIHKVTNINCKWCVAKWRATGRWPDRQPPPQWESREMMRDRLLKEYGMAEYKQFGVVHRAPYKLSVAHREAIRRGVIRGRSSKK
jgi:DNA-directed RNA polymerase subunit RPC12/RpoP